MPMTNSTQTHPQPCDDLIIIRQDITYLKEWKIIAESDLRRFRDLAAKIDLLVGMTAGGGILSIVTLAILVFKLAQP